MTLPAGVTRGPGRRLPVSQRGYFTVFPDGVHFTACRFASLAQCLERGGYVLPLDRKPPAAGAPDNFVHQLQLAGDNTPKNGSTMRQAQKALRVLFPDPADAPAVLFGTMAEVELFEALRKGASVGVGMDCSKWPLYLKRWVGRKYDGGHYVTFDDVRPSSAVAGTVEVQLTDPMFAPARNIRPRWVPWSDVSPAASRLNGEVRVTVMYEANPAPPETCEQMAERLKSELIASEVELEAERQRSEDALTRAEAAEAIIATVRQAVAQP